jgi:hypothetical protein
LCQRAYASILIAIDGKGIAMARISIALAALSLLAATTAGISQASADTWGCSYEKCLQACAKASGRYCSAYCSKELKEKQLAKTCK